MPCSILFILGRWRTILNTQRRMLKKNAALGCLNIALNIGSAILVKTEATDIILVIKNTTDQVMINKRRINFRPGICIDKPIRTPSVVAIPLPPLKPKNKVQLCPHIQLRPSKTGRIVLSARLILEAKKLLKKSIQGQEIVMIMGAGDIYNLTLGLTRKHPKRKIKA